MSCNDLLIAHRANAPEGAVVRVWVEGDPNQFIAFGSLRLVNGSTDLPKRPIKHSDLHPVPYQLPLVGQLSVVVFSINVQFTVNTKATAKVRAEVVLPGGGLHGDPYCHEFVGGHNTVFACTFGASR